VYVPLINLKWSISTIDIYSDLLCLLLSITSISLFNMFRKQHIEPFIMEITIKKAVNMIILKFLMPRSTIKNHLFLIVLVPISIYGLSLIK